MFLQLQLDFDSVLLPNKRGHSSSEHLPDKPTATKKVKLGTLYPQVELDVLSSSSNTMKTAKTAAIFKKFQQVHDLLMIDLDDSNQREKQKELLSMYKT